ncbi:hypothetical protein P9112_011337 [Eukaryota sp. TZLM1-RC]
MNVTDILPSVSVPATTSVLPECTISTNITDLCTSCLETGHLNTYYDLFSLLHPDPPCNAPISPTSNPFFSDIASLQTLSTHLCSIEDALSSNDYTNLYHHTLSVCRLLNSHLFYPLSLKLAEQAVSIAESARDSHNLHKLSLLALSTYNDFIHSILSSPLFCFDLSLISPSSHAHLTPCSYPNLVGSESFNEVCLLYRSAVDLGEVALGILFESRDNIVFDDLIVAVRNVVFEASKFFQLFPDKSSEIKKEIVGFCRKSLSLTERINDDKTPIVHLFLARSLLESDPLESSNHYCSAIESSVNSIQKVLFSCEYIEYLLGNIEANRGEIESLLEITEQAAEGEPDLLTRVNLLKSRFCLKKESSIGEINDSLEDNFKLKLNSPKKGGSQRESRLLKVSMAFARTQKQMDELKM